MQKLIEIMGHCTELRNIETEATKRKAMLTAC